MGHSWRRKIPFHGIDVIAEVPRYYRDADVVILVFDLTDPHSFLELEYWVGELETRIEKEEVGVVVCGNKNDLPRTVTVQ